MHILEQLKALLLYHKEIGIGNYPRNDSINKYLSITPCASSEPKKRGKNEISTQPLSSVGRKDEGGDTRQVPRIPLSDIAEEVESCRACDLHNSRIYPVSGKGNENIRLLVVGDWLCGEGKGLPEGLVFGAEQDRMLARMLSAINLPESDVFVTNVIKCAVPVRCQPQAAHVQSCISYLRRQIVSLEPEVICAMGIVVSRALLGKSQPLSRLRGQFHLLQLSDKIRVPVLATYHPTYLLQNPEMKKATWEDLKLLGRKLGLRFG